MAPATQHSTSSRKPGLLNLVPKEADKTFQRHRKSW